MNLILLFTALCLALALMVAADAGAARSMQRVRVAREDRSGRTRPVRRH